MSSTLSLRMATSIDELRRIDAEIEGFARTENWPPKLEFQIKLMLEEMGINIVKHGHGGDGSHEVEIELVSGPDTVTLHIIDHGRPFDSLTDVPPPDTSSAIEDRPVGGLGVHLVRTLADEARYCRKDGKNHLTLIKRRHG